MGGGNSKANKANNKKKNQKNEKGVKSSDALEIKDQEQLEKEQEALEKQKQGKSKSGELGSQMELFIANNEQLDENPKLTSPLKSGQNRKSLSIMRIEEQTPLTKNERNKLQDSIQVNPSPYKDQSFQDSPIKKDINKQQIGMAQQQKPQSSNFKGVNQQQNNQQQNNLQQNKQVEKKNEKKKQQIDDLSLDISREMQPFKENKKNQPDFMCDISAIYSEEEEETPQQQAQRIFKKIQQVAEINKIQNVSEKQQFFNWPSSGECKIMSVNFKIIYSIKEKDLKMTKSYDFHTASSLSWQKSQQYKTYDFVLQDNAIFDANNASTTHLQNNIISFLVGETGQFICIKDEQSYVKNVRKNQTIINSRGNITNNEQTNSGQRRSRQSMVKESKLEKSKVIIESENQMKEMWSKSITEFLDKELSSRQGNKENQNVNADDNNNENDYDNHDKQTKQQEKQIINYNLVHNGFNCQAIQKIDKKPKEKMEDFLKQNLISNEKYFNMCFKNPKKTIQDGLKVWNIVDDNDDYELMPKKFRFPVLKKHEITTGIMENKNSFMRPHTITTDSCKMIVIDHKRDLFVDIAQELKLLVFLWPERGDNQNEIHFYEELSIFKDICDDALKSMVLDLSRVRALPLSYKPKLKKKYFELY